MSATDMDIKLYWEGRPVDDLSREELITALHYCARRLDEMNQPQNIHALALGKAEMLRRGGTLHAM